MICVARTVSRADCTVDRLKESPPKKEANMIAKTATATIVSAMENAEAAQKRFGLFCSILITRLVQQPSETGWNGLISSKSDTDSKDDAVTLPVNIYRNRLFPPFARESYANLKPFATV